MMEPRYWIAWACVLAGLAVGLGAFGAHGLPTRLASQGVEESVARRRMESLETGVRYHMYHALAMLGIGLAMARGGVPGGQAACLLMTVGIFCFSGWLYGFALAGSTRWPLITPLGGFCYLLAWTTLAAASLRGR